MSKLIEKACLVTTTDGDSREDGNVYYSDTYLVEFKTPITEDEYQRILKHENTIAELTKINAKFTSIPSLIGIIENYEIDDIEKEDYYEFSTLEEYCVNGDEEKGLIVGITDSCNLLIYTDKCEVMEIELE